MQEIEYQTCKHCHRSLPKTGEFFARNTIPGEGRYYKICRDCLLKILLQENWKDGKLKCWVCGEWLDPENFQEHPYYSYRGHREKRCRKCKLEQNKLARSQYPEETKLYKILLERWLSARERAKTKNLEFSITKENLQNLWDKQKGLCALSGIPMTYELDNGRIYTNVSLDLIIPSKGYTIDNILLVCMGINQMKSDLDLNTLLFLCNSLINYLKEANNKN